MSTYNVFYIFITFLIYICRSIVILYVTVGFRLTMALKNQLMKLAECSICLETMTEPKFLQCGHSNCFNCIKSLWESSLEGSLACPQCRKKTRITNVADFPRLKANFYIKSVTDLLAESDNTPHIEVDDKQVQTAYGTKHRMTQTTMEDNAAGGKIVVLT